VPEHDLITMAPPAPPAPQPKGESWNTKYGSRRVRQDPPTLEEAVFAASGITTDPEEQAEIAASLMGIPVEAALAEVRKTLRSVQTTRMISTTQGAARSVVVERRTVRRPAGATVTLTRR
jgi:hypothetical protein